MKYKMVSLKEITEEIIDYREKTQRNWEGIGHVQGIEFYLLKILKQGK